MRGFVFLGWLTRQREDRAAAPGAVSARATP